MVDNKFEIDPVYLEWSQNKTPEYMGKIIKKYTPLLMSELPKYVGNLPPTNIKSFGKKIIADAIKTYNPEKSKLTTHIINNLQKLHRINYETSSALHMSEELQRGVNTYKTVKDYLSDKYGRDPSTEELADHLGWTESKVNRTEKMMRQEVMDSSLEFAPKEIQMDNPKIDYLYYDLDPIDKKIFEGRTGYGGVQVRSNNDIAKLLKISPAAVSIRAKKIAEKISDYLGHGANK